jgi:predicted ester cyclase
MSIEDNKNLVRRFYREIDAGNIDALDELVAEDYLDHSPAPFPGLEPSGREGLKRAFRLFWDATPGTHHIEDQIAEGDKVVTRKVFTGTHEGRFQGLEPTGRAVEIHVIDIVRVADGRIVEHWNCVDRLGLLAQLGAVPEMAAD